MLTPNEDVRTIARAYCAAAGFEQPIEGHYVPVDEARAWVIAAAYDALPTLVQDTDTISAYNTLAREVEMQYRLLERAGYRFYFTENDPYPDSASMLADLRAKRLHVFAGSATHPLLTTRVNLMFRAVHDVFGHGAEGYQFGPRGEENAWIHHSQMFTPLAQVALTTETRGQNSWVNFGPHAYLPVQERPFATQKAALLPAWAWDWRQALDSVSR